ncbi:hypothetical protein ACWGJT_03280 [Streptomyces xantholiticus]
MSSYSVYVEFNKTDASSDIYAGLHEALIDWHGAVGPAGNGNVSVRLLVEADSVIEAANRGITAARVAALQYNFTPDTVIGIEVISEAELDRRDQRRSSLKACMKRGTPTTMPGSVPLTGNKEGATRPKFDPGHGAPSCPWPAGRDGSAG